jgi:hypothetical protein
MAGVSLVEQWRTTLSLSGEVRIGAVRRNSEAEMCRRSRVDCSFYKNNDKNKKKGGTL